jgi:hypothetical protein
VDSYVQSVDVNQSGPDGLVAHVVMVVNNPSVVTMDPMGNLSVSVMCVPTLQAEAAHVCIACPHPTPCACSCFSWMPRVCGVGPGTRTQCSAAPCSGHPPW